MLETLGGISDERGALTRTFLSPAMRRANRLVGTWMREAGLAVREDTVGNLIGRLEIRPGAKTLLLGSHLDTVRHAGKYDGPVGVLLPLLALENLRRRGVRLPFNVEVIGFSEEEGVRFDTGYLGSEGYCGWLKAGTLAMKDAAGVTVGAALKDFNGGRFKPPPAAHRRGELLGYVEVHIEQGPVLEARRLAVGVVAAIAGQSRFRITWTGRAGHAGTTPMRLRRDALTGAAEFALGIEAVARRTPGLVATVGVIEVPSGAGNVIPGEAVHALDVRHASDRLRRRALVKLGRIAQTIARRRGLAVKWERTQDNSAVACSPALTARLNRSVKSVQGRTLKLVSGAGHDGVVVSSIAPVAMLFVRCRGGLSHHPDEFASPSDLGVALAVLTDFLQRMGEEK
ncbi:MAG: hyuC [Verrucomicrobia bacterium]|nr:hyuC [Verrucomicrobiota bacterium]